MNDLVMSDLPEELNAILSRGEDNQFAAHRQDPSGAPLDWPTGVVTMRFANNDYELLPDLTQTADVVGPDATWVLSSAEIEAIFSAKVRRLQILVDDDILYAGALSVRSGWDGVQTVNVRAVIPGPRGPKGDPGNASDGIALQEHIDSPTPHPAYDDGPSFVLLYENAKV